jgi:hypothetical protein
MVEWELNRGGPWAAPRWNVLREPPSLGGKRAHAHHFFRSTFHQLPPIGTWLEFGGSGTPLGEVLGVGDPQRRPLDIAVGSQKQRSTQMEKQNIGLQLETIVPLESDQERRRKSCATGRTLLIHEPYTELQAEFWPS